MSKVNCLTCEKEMEIKQYCSRPCYPKFIQIKLNCIVCGKEHIRRQCEKDYKCCSSKCANDFRKGKATWKSFWRDATQEQKIERIKLLYEKKVIRKSDNECWDWSGMIDDSGYASMKVHRKNEKASRMSWLMNFGEIPNGLLVCHTCDNRLCTNPKHLWLGTHQMNVTDMMSKGRHVVTRGGAKLTEEQVKEIKKLLKEGITVTEIAKTYNMKQSSISLIKLGKNWKHVPHE